MLTHGIGLFKAGLGLIVWSGWPSHLPMWRGTGNGIPCLPPILTAPLFPTSQPHLMSAFLLNCFEYCGKWIILKWKPGQSWFGLETTQTFKRSQKEGLGLVCFLFFMVHRQARKGNNTVILKSKHLCFSENLKIYTDEHLSNRISCLAC